jgi:hypothetical protein
MLRDTGDEAENVDAQHVSLGKAVKSRVINIRSSRGTAEARDTIDTVLLY